MRKFICYIALMSALCASTNLFAQNVNEVNGKVTDSEDNPVVGATIIEKGTNNGTVTDREGFYKLKLKNNKAAILVFSFIGMETREVVYEGNSIINVLLNISTTELDEVVAIGYGSAKRKDLTGAVSSISGAELEKTPIANVADALKGKIAGVVVTSTSGAPEADIVVRVRGGISITQDNSPLYIIDGVPSESGLQGLSPLDILTIDVLKDASSTAIYGSRGANGVVIISTKQGKEGRNTVSYEMYYGVKKPSKTNPVLTPLEFVLWDFEIQGGDEWAAIFGPIENAVENYGERKGIDWSEKLFADRVAISQTHKISASGGNQQGNYNLSYNYNNDGGIMPGSGVSKNTLRLSSNYKMNSKLSFGVNISYYTEGLNALGDYNESAVNTFFTDLILYKPIISLKGDDAFLLEEGGLDDGSSIDVDDPLTKMSSQVKLYDRKKVSYNASFNYTFNKHLTYNTVIGLSENWNENSTFYTSISSQARLANGPYGSLYQNSSRQIYESQTLSYRTDINKIHKIDFLIGNELRETKTKMLSVSAGGFPEENFGTDYFNLATIAMLPTSGLESQRSVSFFSRANYNYKDKYILNASLRADGSTKFGKNNKWGFFPAAGFGWRLSEENFIKSLNVFSNLKFRATYGWTGNDNIGNYRSLATYSASWTPINNNGYTTFSPSFANSDLRWEINKQANIGLDLGFFENRISASFDIYNTTTDDLLLEAKVPYTSGYSTAMRNIGSTNSRGLEISLQSFNIRKNDLSWSTNFNMAFNKIKVLKLADSDRWEINSNAAGKLAQTDFIIEVGRSTGLMYGYIYDGLYMASDFDWDAIKGWKLKAGIPDLHYSSQPLQPGSPKYKDVEPDGLLDAKDMTFIGDANPDFTGGIMNNFNYKNFDFSFFCEFKVGADIYNANLYKYLNPGKYKSTTRFVYENHYRTIDEKGTLLMNLGDIEALNELNKNAFLPSRTASIIPFSSLLIENGDYLRLSQVTLGYTLPNDLLKKVKIKSFRIYSTIYNVLTLTNYSGYDPEVSMNRNNGLTPGIDKGSHPRTASFVFGANISF